MKSLEWGGLSAKALALRALLPLLLLMAGASILAWFASGFVAQAVSRQYAIAAAEQAGKSIAGDRALIGRVASGASVSAADDLALREAMRQTSVLRYKIFDAGGILKFDSNSKSLPGADSVNLIAHNKLAADSAARGRWLAEVVEKEGRQIAEIYMPIENGGRTIAVQEIYLDRTIQHHQVRSLTQQILIAVMALTALVFGLPALIWLYKSTRLSRREIELRKSWQMLNSVLDNVPGSIVVKHPETLRYEMINRAGAKVIGLPKPEIIGKHASELFPAASGTAISARDRAALESTEGALNSPDNVVVTPGHGERVISTRRIVIRDENSKPVRLILVNEDVTEERAQAQRINFLANHDVLTGLLNRSRFQELATQKLASLDGDAQALLISLDLDGFKEINDTFGHPAGDEFLRQFASRLRRLAGDRGDIARLGGDEFAILLPFENGLDPKSTIETMLRGLGDAIEVEGRDLEFSSSIGASLACRGADFVTSLREADVALYEAKTAGKNICKIFGPEMMARTISRKAMEADLRRAIVEDQFILHFQPIMDLDTGGVASVEALVRWMHPERGMVPPLEFIPVAEESGMIVRIGEIILEKACAAAMSWPGDIRLSVNLSPVQFRDRGLASHVAEILASTGLPAHRLELEITEAMLLHNNETNTNQLNKLRALGIGIVMDDFGTGYSSLNYLRDFKFDKIKIDRSYIKDIAAGDSSSLAILNAVIGMARDLKLTTTAEGVETREQLDILREAGCSEMQGYYYSRPLTADRIASFLAAETPGAAVAA